MNQSVNESIHPVVTVYAGGGTSEMGALNCIEVFGDSPLHHVPPSNLVLTDCHKLEVMRERESA